MGSRIAKIVGCQKEKNRFDKRVSLARDGGMTRLEISLCQGAMTKYKPFQPSMKTRWIQKVGAAFERLHRLVLNDEEVLELAHRRLNISHFLGELGQCKVQILAIGHQASWLVSHRTATSSTTWARSSGTRTVAAAGSTSRRARSRPS